MWLHEQITLPTHNKPGIPPTTPMAPQTPTPQLVWAEHRATHYTSIPRIHPRHLRKHQHHPCPLFTPIPQPHQYPNPSHNPRRRTTPMHSAHRARHSIPRRIKGTSCLHGSRRQASNDSQRCPCPPRRPRNLRTRTWASRVKHRLGTITKCRAGTGEDCDQRN